MTDKKDYGPLWQIEQQIKHHEALAVEYGRDAQRYMEKAEDARHMAERYKHAYDALKDANP